jgi:UDP-N-acetylglucosamine 1-carboxyvinyltransferase
MLEALGKSILILNNNEIKIIENKQIKTNLNWKERSIRNTLLILGALLARFGRGQVPLPGGCKLGERKHDIHIMLLKKFGAHVWEDNYYLYAETLNKNLIGTDIHLPIRSTGATENAIICGSLAKGVTRIWNPHIRPEIVDLVNFLRKMGAKITIYGQQHIEINGADGLLGTKHDVIFDNMEAITWIAASVMTHGDLEIFNFPYSDLEIVLAHLKSAGAKLYFGENSLIVRGGTCYPLDISTGPHPGINSDVQPILAAWASCSRGQSRIVDLRFPGRYNYTQEMGKMGLEYQICGDMLLIIGNGGNLKGAEVQALDLRTGAALTLCALIAQGETIIYDAWQIDRGYVDFPVKLKELGANVKWED